MAIIEVQFQEDSFCTMVKAEMDRLAWPSEIIQFVAQFGKYIFTDANGFPWKHDLLLDKIECTSVAIAHDPKVADVLPGTLLIELNVRIYLTSRENALAAGHLAIAPPEQVIDTRFWVNLRLTLMQGIEYTMVKAEDSRFNAIALSGMFQWAGAFPQQLSSRPIILFASAILAKDGVVALRFGTSVAEQQNRQAFLDSWSGNRLESAGWGLFITGHLLARILTAEINDATQQAAAASSNPRLEVIAEANGNWNTQERKAQAQVQMNAIDALPADFDVPFSIRVSVTALPYLNSGFHLDTEIQWVAEDLLSNLGLGYVQSMINDAVRDKLQPPGSLQTETARGDTYVRYRSTTLLNPPRSHTFTADITASRVDDHGIAITGPLSIRPAPVATWSMTSPYWMFSGDCRSRSMRQRLHPGVVQLVGSDPYYELRQLVDLNANASWVMTERRSMPGTIPVTLEIEFQPAPAMSDKDIAGKPLSSYLYTNMGLRWVNFGMIPEKPVVSELEFLHRTAELISHCMAISDRWGRGVLNLNWLIDPPAMNVDFGFPLMKEWEILGRGIEDAEVIEVSALQLDGRQRRIGFIPVVGATLFFRAVTEQDETLELRTGAPMHSPAPQIRCRWIAPWAIIQLSKPVRTFSLRGDCMLMHYADGSTEEKHLSDWLNFRNSTGPAAALCAHSAEHGNSDQAGEINFPIEDVKSLAEYRYASTSDAQDESNRVSSSVTVLHNNLIVLGVAGHFQPAEMASGQDLCPLVPLHQISCKGFGM